MTGRPSLYWPGSSGSIFSDSHGSTRRPSRRAHSGRRPAGRACAGGGTGFGPVPVEGDAGTVSAGGIGRAHLWTPVPNLFRIPAFAFKKKKDIGAVRQHRA